MFDKSIVIFPANSDIRMAERGDDAPVRVKFGIDPTADRLHLGHLVPILVLKKLRDLGHEIYIILGTQTAQLGDPSGRDKMRPILTKKAVADNAEKILEQVRRALNGHFVVERNHQWFEDMNTARFLQIVSKFTAGHLLSRDAFQARQEAGEAIGAHELLVPILQGIDSLEVKADIEVGGSDQLFNFQVSRKLQEMEGQKPQVCILCPIINGTDGRKMSKSFGNCIFLDETPEDIFGKVMSISDETMEQWFPLFTNPILIDMMTNLSPKDDKGEVPPMVRKKWLAWEIVKELHDEEAADNARRHFEGVIQQKKEPEVIPEIAVEEDFEGRIMLAKAVAKIRDCSTSEAMRLIQQGGVKVNGEPAGSKAGWEVIAPGSVVRVGKRHFGKIISAE